MTGPGRFGGLDSAFLALETPRQPMHAAMAAIVDTAAMVEPYSFETALAWARDEVERRPLFRRRVAEGPLGLGRPRWVEEPHVDVATHVTRVSLPPGAGLSELWRLAGDFVSWPLERDRPLWAAWVVEGLGRGRLGVLAKIHHALADGESAAEMLADLLTAGAGTPAEGAGTPAEGAGTPAGPLPGTVAALGRLAAGGMGLRGGSAAPFSAPRTPFNASLSPRRQVATASMDLAAVRRVGRAWQATVNDVVLALCAGALRRHLQRNGDLPSRPLVALVPVSARQASPSGANRLSGLFVGLPTDLAEPSERLRAVGEATRRAKEDHEALGPGTLMAWAEHVPPALIAPAAHVFSGLKLGDHLPPLCNLVVSNVAGPRQALSFRGARLRAIYPLGPLVEGVGLNVTVFSHARRLDVGLVSCPELLPGLADLAGELRPELQELAATADAKARGGAGARKTMGVARRRR
jgi:diacylglycerol O-acyltransferase